MSRIRVNPGQLHQVAGSISNISAEVLRISSEVMKIVNKAPSYDGQFAPKVRALAMDAFTRGQTQQRNLASLAESLSRRAFAFEKADNLKSFTTNFFKPIADIPLIGKITYGRLPLLMYDFVKLGTVINASLKLSKCATLINSREFIIRGSHSLKTAAGFSKNLTRINIENIPMHVLKQELGHFSTTDKIAFGVGIAFKWAEDYHEYKDQGPSKVVAAMATDTLISSAAHFLGKSVGVAGGAKLGLIIGGALFGPPGALVGAAVGGVVGSLAMQWGTEYIADKSGFRMWAIDNLSKGIDWTVEKGKRAYESISASVGQVAQKVKQIDDVIRKEIRKLFPAPSSYLRQLAIPFA